MMHMQPRGFLDEVVDEQIEQLLYIDREQQGASEARVVQDLQGLYAQVDAPEQVRRSLDSIWSRLADRISPESQTLFSMPDTDQARAIREDASGTSPMAGHANSATDKKQAGSGQWSEHKVVSLPVRPVSDRSGGRHLRRTLVLSALAAIVLLSVFSWLLVARLEPRQATTTGHPYSGPGTAIPTIPKTPAPQSLRDQAHQLLGQFHQEVAAWGRSHLEQDTQNGKTYALDYAYDHQGVGGILDNEVSQASGSADYQNAIALIQSELANLHAMEANFADHTPWNQAHSADLSLLSHYKLNSGTVIVVSLLEQSMRVYQNGQLARAFQVTTGRFELPTLPGSWWIESKMSPTTLKSAEPQDSPFWFPPTNVHYAMVYHSGGYLIIDGWWRTRFGPGTQFPHHDDSGSAAANNGSSGSVDLAEGDMAWLYKNTRLETPVVIY